jgi:hypothetical protein
MCNGGNDQSVVVSKEIETSNRLRPFTKRVVGVRRTFLAKYRLRLYSCEPLQSAFETCRAFSECRLPLYTVQARDRLSFVPRQLSGIGKVDKCALKELVAHEDQRNHSDF